MEASFTPHGTCQPLSPSCLLPLKVEHSVAAASVTKQYKESTPPAIFPLPALLPPTHFVSMAIVTQFIHPEASPLLGNHLGGKPTDAQHRGPLCLRMQLLGVHLASRLPLLHLFPPFFADRVLLPRQKLKPRSGHLPLRLGAALSYGSNQSGWKIQPE